MTRNILGGALLSLSACLSFIIKLDADFIIIFFLLITVIIDVLLIINVFLTIVIVKLSLFVLLSLSSSL